MNRTQSLREILDIAREQRKKLACADLEAINDLQEKRQQLQSGVQSLDECSPDESDLVAQIRDLDRETHLLLLSKLADSQEELQKIATLKRLLHRHRPSSNRPTNRLSCHI